MALLNSLFSGVSGLQNNQAEMDVIGNNIANVNTIGFKSSRVTFADSFNEFIKAGTNPTATSGGSNSFQIGLGMKINSIDRNWNQGTFEQTGITTDLALQGPGMFILKSNGQQLYSRAGSFIFDAKGQLVNPQNGAIVQGKVANGLGDIPAGTTLQNIVVNKNLRLPAIPTTLATWGGNLDSSSTTQRTDIVELTGNMNGSDNTTTNAYPAPGPYSASDSSTYDSSKIYGKDGTEYELHSWYTQVAGSSTTSGSWTYNYQVTDSSGNPLATDLTGSVPLTFGQTGCTTPQIDSISDASKNVDFKLNFASLSNTTGPTAPLTKVDKGETPSPVLGSVTIYDSLGNPTTLSLEFDHIDNNNWAWKASVPASAGTLNTSLTNGAQGTVSFNQDGTISGMQQLNPTTGKNVEIVGTPLEPQLSFTPASGALPQLINLNFGAGQAGITQTSLTSQVASLSQNGSASAALSNLNIDQYGNVLGIFSNGNSRTLAQVMVATFTNLNGLVSVGNNMYNVAANAGSPLIDVPGENSSTTIQSGALEQSNVDLSSEFTKMIVTQRGFQANARVITTADNLLQDLTQLIR